MLFRSNIMLEITVTQRISMRTITMILTEKKMQRIIMMMLWRNMGNRGEKVKNSFKSINMYDIMEPDFLSG